MPDIQEAKCFEFTVQILPPPRSSKGEAKKNLRFKHIWPPYRFISVNALGETTNKNKPVFKNKNTDI